MTFQYDSMMEPLFEDVNLSIHENWKLALIGRNGRGKTSFLKILLEQLPYEGSVRSSLRFSYFPTYPEPSENITAEEMLLKNNPAKEPWELERELSYMKLSPEILQRRFQELSGGEQTKLLLIELFLNEQSFSLIDEPTNNLDADGRNVVGQYLKNKQGFIVVSHDQRFLNSFVDHVLAINRESVDLIKGNIDEWKREKDRADHLSRETNSQLGKEIKRLSDVSGRVGSWGLQRENSTKDASERRLAAKQMKRSKAIRKRTEEKIEEKRSLISNIEQADRLKMNVQVPRNQILYLRNFSILRNGKPLFEPVDADVYPNDRFFITGKNGAGKSSLINFLLGREEVETTGEHRVQMPEKLSVLEQKNQREKDYGSLLGRLSFREKEEYLHLLRQLGMERSRFSDQTSRHWSEGEQKKVFLAHAILGSNQLFIWDEVTNYLDLFIVEQLIASIREYEPTMIAVDHNEHFADAVATKKLHLTKR
ncbi:ATP-binding cassette domain-containing protein [Alteribacter natronophilus]|uniref:ATP-binding cassette domain-containing protein n=1 Tax=Alteribacter natronophilus TaxID=2583810 RepID=UPI001FEBE1E4|nr:ATP-binding cassette domain-containing protein [Alteribacter natronophilus]